ncbi:MAG: insulinase family protein [Endomicrobiales bacterium]|nr:insulinase family protein [Endomicrobiales bacterium]
MKRLLTVSLLLALAFSSAHCAKGVKKLILDNGLTVILKENHEKPVVSVQVWVKVGSVNETAETSGLSHFLEHLIFKGTEKYPGQEIARRVEINGGMINAATSKEYTEFYIDIQKDGAKEAVEILADAMANAVFPADEIEKERLVVLEEIKRHDDNPGSVLYDLFNETAYAASPYRSSIIGSSEVVENVTREEIARYYHDNYVPEKMFVSITGDFNAKEMTETVRSTFGKQAERPAPKEPELSEKNPKKGGTSVKSKNVAQEYLIYGFLGPSVESDDQFAGDLASAILGGGKSSRFYRILREEKKLVYEINASFWSQRGAGIFAVSGVYEPSNRKKVLDAIAEILNDFAANGPTETELNRARAMAKSQWYVSQETCHEQGASQGYWHMQGRPEIAEKYLEKILNVEKKDIIGFFRKYYDKDFIYAALLEPKK